MTAAIATSGLLSRKNGLTSVLIFSSKSPLAKNRLAATSLAPVENLASV